MTRGTIKVFGRSAVVPCLLALAGCGKSKLDSDIDATVASTKTCGDYAQMRAMANCTRFVEEGRKKDAPLAVTMDKTVHGLQRRWQATCAAQSGDITRLELMTTITLQRNGIGPGDSIAMCSAEVQRQLASYPALAKDITH